MSPLQIPGRSFLTPSIQLSHGPLATPTASVVNSLIFVAFGLSSVVYREEIEAKNYDDYRDALAKFLTPLSVLFYLLSIFMKPKLLSNK